MKKPKAVIAAPSLSDFYTTPHRISGLGERIVEKILNREGWDTRLFLFPKMKKSSQPLPPALSYLKRFLIPGEFGPTSFFSRYHRFGPSPSESAAIILAENPDAVFLSCFAFAYADDTLALASLLKEQRPSVSVYAGGSGVTVLPGYFLKDSGIDAVIPGEAEETLNAFLKEGMNDRHSGAVPLRHPDKIDFSISMATSPRNGLRLSTTLSRGCPRRCTFCANHLTQGRAVRTVSFDDFLSAITALPKDAPLHVNFEDDNLLLRKNYFFAILEAIRTKFPIATFSAENGMDYLLLDTDTVDKLVAFGFTQFNLSMASVASPILKSTHRNGDPQRLQEILKYLSRKHIPSITYFICGLKEDTVETVLDNLRFLATQPTLVGISLFYPVPGLPGFTDTEPFYASASLRCTGSAAYPWSGSLSTSQMITAFRLARFVNLLKKDRPSPEEIDLLTRIQAEKRLLTFCRNGKEKRMVRPPGLDREMERAFFESSL